MVNRQRILLRWRPFLQGAKIIEQKEKINSSLWFPVSIKALFLSLLGLAKLWPGVWSCIDPALKKEKMVNSSLYFLAGPGLLPNR